jgi:hypothetical protein
MKNAASRTTQDGKGRLCRAELRQPKNNSGGNPSRTHSPGGLSVQVQAFDVQAFDVQTFDVQAFGGWSCRPDSVRFGILGVLGVQVRLTDFHSAR